MKIEDIPKNYVIRNSEQSFPVHILFGAKDLHI